MMKVVFFFNNEMTWLYMEFFLSSYNVWVFCSCHHELETARINGLLGNIDANTGDPQIGND